MNSRLLYFVAFALVLGKFFHAHHVLGLTHPVPWPDESSFLWPALAFGDSGSLYAREVYEVREVMWMPPGYMVLSGIVFKLTGFSLSWARWLSALYLAGAMTCLAVTLGRSAARYGAVILIAIFASSPVALLASNTARMETLVCLVMMLGLALLCAGYRLAGFSVLLFGPLVHPVGLFSLAATIAYVTLESWRKLSPKRWEIAVLILALSSWIAYAAHVAANWSAFLADVELQLGWKHAEHVMSGGITGRLTEPGVLVAAALLALGWLGVFRHARHAAPIAAFASALLIQILVTTGWLYDLYVALLYLLVALVVNEVASVVIEKALQGRANTAVGGAQLAGGVLLAAPLFWLTRENLAKQSVKLTTVERGTNSPSYFEDSDRRLVADALRELDTPSIVQFSPDGDSLLFHDLRSPKLSFSQASFHDAMADVYVFHESIWVPPVVNGLMQGRLALRHGIVEPVSSWRVIANRDGTERWRLYRRKPVERLP